MSYSFETKVTLRSASAPSAKPSIDSQDLTVSCFRNDAVVQIRLNGGTPSRLLRNITVRSYKYFQNEFTIEDRDGKLILSLPLATGEQIEKMRSILDGPSQTKLKRIPSPPPRNVAEQPFAAYPPIPANAGDRLRRKPSPPPAIPIGGVPSPNRISNIPPYATPSTQSFQSMPQHGMISPYPQLQQSPGYGVAPSMTYPQNNQFQTTPGRYPAAPAAVNPRSEDPLDMLRIPDALSGEVSHHNPYGALIEDVNKTLRSIDSCINRKKYELLNRIGREIWEQHTAKIRNRSEREPSDSSSPRPDYLVENASRTSSSDPSYPSSSAKDTGAKRVTLLPPPTKQFPGQNVPKEAVPSYPAITSGTPSMPYGSTSYSTSSSSSADSVSYPTYPASGGYSASPTRSTPHYASPSYSASSAAPAYSTSSPSYSDAGAQRGTPPYLLSSAQPASSDRAFSSPPYGSFPASTDQSDASIREYFLQNLSDKSLVDICVEGLKKMRQMGIETDQALPAIVRANGNVNRAVNYVYH
ncbi:uncharacterized protein MONOS_5181 [Monocercomonoides exilis]|uniref:uncharacterized protein n=1 Tax=Monocercomonoides exilis TaxID=2049356 RepID=UPI0035593BA5|nr:hypothetical protein MONOS_5181 [Monocercomonoides exilis]|eukprot:MONOS_5181.1-p1 / transcript=MONOS_5181.1 / gene=MONOS_5181 / organism=Monocercomonoides_exilis_PA203 / gene_product=unspecified product / transcript_product=unspecified product / location=Mono_scaffold00148:38129-39945(-) / protein_length=525 / sequence_SO=supercontig / SO=protein_coding / is_pseudo=false